MKFAPKKYKPRGVTILFEDSHIIVIEKPGGLLSIGTDRDKTKTAHSILNDYVRKGDPRSRNRVYIVHRLDRETSGILIFARNERIKETLQSGWHDIEKHYLTVVHGSFVPSTGTITSYLVENSAFKIFSTADATAGKLSHTKYAVLKESRGVSLLDIQLLTGRKHQIRVHMSESGHPVVGDKKYGKANDTAATLALHASSLSFNHPVTGKRMSFETALPDFVIRLVGKYEPAA